jgi:putative heme iron utilization protein
MKEEAAAKAAELIGRCRVGALGTLHEQAPAVSMTPYSLLQAPFAFIVLVSGLSAHTRDMVADRRVALMVMEPERDDANVHALARVSVQGEARPVRPGDAHHAAARAGYEARFPGMRELFDLGDFGLFAIRPTAIRVVAGFAQAHSVAPESLAAAFARVS